MPNSNFNQNSEDDLNKSFYIKNEKDSYETELETKKSDSLV